MRKGLFDLSIEEFTRVLLDYEEVYEIEIENICNRIEKHQLKGTYNQIIDVVSCNPHLCKDIESKLFDYNIELNELDIYNYIEYKTANFNMDKVKILKNEMDVFYMLTYCEEINQIVKEKYIDLDMEIPYIERDLITKHKKKHEHIRIPDYRQMREKIFFCRDYMYFIAMALLNRKLSKTPINNKTNILPDVLNTDEAKELFNRAIELGLMKDDYTWDKGLQLAACFAREMSIRLDIGKGDRISWKPFEELFKLENGKLRSNYNDIQKTGQNPSDINLVDAVFE